MHKTTLLGLYYNPFIFTSAEHAKELDRILAVAVDESLTKKCKSLSFCALAKKTAIVFVWNKTIHADFAAKVLESRHSLVSNTDSNLPMPPSAPFKLGNCFLMPYEPPSVTSSTMRTYDDFRVHSFARVAKVLRADILQSSHCASERDM